MLICKQCGCKIVQGAFELRTGIGTAKFCPCCGGELQKKEQPATENDSGDLREYHQDAMFH